LILRMAIDVTNLSCMFAECNLLSSISDLYIQSNSNNENDINFENYFSNSLNISLSEISSKGSEDEQDDNSININPFIKLFLNKNNLLFIDKMYYNCYSLKSLPDISKWNTSNVNNMSYIFYNCNSLISLPDISKWNTSNVNKMSYIFYNCNSLISLPDISKWNASKEDTKSSLITFYDSFISKLDTTKLNISFFDIIGFQREIFDENYLPSWKYTDE